MSATARHKSSIWCAEVTHRDANLVSSEVLEPVLAVRLGFSAHLWFGGMDRSTDKSVESC